ncbi:MAG: sulfotransferase [Crocosphaera sp.]|nr:sulfotransferase [Crocosphaera sp.]
MLKNLLRKFPFWSTPEDKAISSIDKPIFIIGCGRSGTTLLFQLLQFHPQLSPTKGYPDGEDHLNWLEYGNCRLSGFGHPDVGEGTTGISECLHMNRDDVTPEIVQRMSSYYYYEVLQEDPHKRVLTKCPHLSNKLDYVLGIFPEAKFIHIIRDCLPVVASWMKVIDQFYPHLLVYLPETEYPCFSIISDKNSPEAQSILNQQSRIYYTGSDPEMFVNYWCEVNRNIPRQLPQKDDQLLTIKYEDLIVEPLSILNQICDFCELESMGEVKVAIDPKRNQNYYYLSQDKIDEFLQVSYEVRKQFCYVN